MKENTKKVWLVAHPLSQYKEDVKDLAMRNNVRIIDVIFRKDIDVKSLVSDAPKLTKKKALKAKAVESTEVQETESKK